MEGNYGDYGGYLVFLVLFYGGVFVGLVFVLVLL